MTARPRRGPLVRQADAARALGINRATIHHHIGTGALAVRTVAGVRFVTRGSLMRLLRRLRAIRRAREGK